MNFALAGTLITVNRAPSSTGTVSDSAALLDEWLPFQIDHIIARKHGGLTRPNNTGRACLACNHHKGPCIGGRDKVTEKLVPLFNPRRHSWHRHFRWDGPVLVGVTPIGRVTVTVLKINLDYRVGFRRSRDG
jgi:hypothetical protein